MDSSNSPRQAAQRLTERLAAHRTPDDWPQAIREPLADLTTWANAPLPANGVATDISDLFFNTDHENAKRYDVPRPGQLVFTGWDQATLQGNAAAFLECLERLGVPVPDVDSLVADFLGRV